MYPCLQLWPEEEVPGFKASLEIMQQACAHLAQRVLMMMGIGLRLEVSSISYFSGGEEGGGGLRGIQKERRSCISK